MNCYYCNNPLTNLGFTENFDGKCQTHYSCRFCPCYQKYADDMLVIITVFDIKNSKGTFAYRVSFVEKKAVIYSTPNRIALTDIAFTIDTVPNWTPANFASKIESLLIFS